MAALVWLVTRTKWGPLVAGLAERKGTPVRVVVRGRRNVGNLFEFEDGYRVVAPYNSAGRSR